MSEYFVASALDAIEIYPILKTEFDAWLPKQSAVIRNWLTASNFKAESGQICLMANRDGNIKRVYLGLSAADDYWAFAAVPTQLKSGVFQIKGHWSALKMERIAVAWALGCYKFAEYKTATKSTAKLVITEKCDTASVENIVASTFLARDLINRPAEDMGPVALAKAMTSVALEYGASVNQVIGDDLLKAGFNAIHMVGRGSATPPRLLELRWGKEKHPQITLVGKGVCFDSGGLNLKITPMILKMKKDMAGAAYALAMARLIMAAKLPVRLRVLIPAVENMVDGNSYKPGDVIKTYKGLTVENTNTDAEGRLILADALALACEEQPALLIDFASLTGAARIALGLDITALFTADDKVALELEQNSTKEFDPIWRMPLYEPYRELLDSDIADLTNAASSGWGGSITAALFLQQFVTSEIPWLHFDVACFNEKPRPGRPKGADVAGLRALFKYICQHYG